jgi:hypothetical protein
MTLDDDDIEAIAERVAAKIGATASSGWVDVERVAAWLGVEPDWVYRRWRQLGGVKLGTAKNSPVRFDLQSAVERARALDAPPEERPRARRGRPRTSPGLEPGATLLQGRGR